MLLNLLAAEFVASCFPIVKDASSPFVELLEDRIAPASASFVDVDGDLVSVITTKGTDTDLQAIVDAGLDGGQLKSFNIANNPLFDGTSLKIAVKTIVGDGQVNVWHVDATGIDLGSVEVGGDLAKLTAGDAIDDFSVKSVKVASIGVVGGATDKVWIMTGSTSSFSVTDNVNGAHLEWINTPGLNKVSAGKVTIGGSLLGGTEANSGLILLTTGAGGLSEIKSLSIGGSLTATDYDSTGTVKVGDIDLGLAGKIGSVFIGGSLIGDNNKVLTGSIMSGGSIGNIKVVGGLDGGGFASGSITAAGDIGTVDIGLSLTGGDEESSGTIGSVTGDIKAVTIGGSLTGGLGKRSGSVIAAFGGDIASVTITGSITGGGGNYSGSVESYLGKIGNVKVGSILQGGAGDLSGAIRSATGLGAVSIGGSIFGDAGAASGSVATGGKLTSLTVLGDISGGTNTSSGAVSGNIISKVIVTGSLYGGTGAVSGFISAITLGSVSIGVEVAGGAGLQSGFINAGDGGASSIKIGTTLGGFTGVGSGSIKSVGPLKFVSIGNGIAGGDGASSGAILASSSLGTLKVGGDLTGGAGAFSGYVNVIGKTTKIEITGSLFGDAGEASGSIETVGLLSSLTIGGDLQSNSSAAASAASLNLMDAGTIKVGGSLVGGFGNFTGSIAMNDAKSLSVGGRLFGFNGNSSGSITFNKLSTLFVGRDDFNFVSLRGDFGANSGSIIGVELTKGTLTGGILGGSTAGAGVLNIGTIGTLTVGDWVKGGIADDTGLIKSDLIKGKLRVGGFDGADDYSNNGGLVVTGDVKSLLVDYSIWGGNATMAGIKNSGFISVGGTLSSITVGSNISSGFSASDASWNLGSVRAGVIGTMLVKGYVEGTPSQHVLITAQGDITATTGKNLAIGKLTILGNVRETDILGGYDQNGSTLNGAGGNNGGSAQLGTITFNGNMTDSVIATGIDTNNAAPNHWAEDTNTALPSPGSIVSSIAKIVVKGTLGGSVQNGIAAGQVLSLSVGGSKASIPPGPQFFPIASGPASFLKQLG